MRATRGPDPDPTRHAPAEIGCPEVKAALGCHLIVVLAGAGGGTTVSAQPFPLLAVRAADHRLYWLHGISFALARVGSSDDLERASESLSLGCAVGGVRAVAMSGLTMLVLTEAALLAFSPGDMAPRHLVTEPLGWSLAATPRCAAWTTSTAGSGLGDVKRIDLATGVVTVVASSETNPEAVAIDAAGVYWAVSDPEGGGAIRMLHAGDTSPTTIADSQAALRALATDADTVYWLTVDHDERRLRCRSKRQGGAVRELARWPGAGIGAPEAERLEVERGDAYLAMDERLERVPVAGGAAVVLARIRPPGRLVSFAADRHGCYAAAEFQGSGPPGYASPARPMSRPLPPWPA